MTATKEPDNLNLGGIWLFNPPEPAAHTTDLRGAFSSIVPPGVCQNIPTAWKLTVPGTDSTFPEQVGTHILRRRKWPESLIAENPVGTVHLGWWKTEDREIFQSSLGFFDAPAWTLFYGTLRTTVGPYANEALWPGFQRWWLLGDYRRDLEYVGIVYQLWNPQADENATPGEIGDSGQLSDRYVFDGLSPNRFAFVVDSPPSLGPLAGQEYITVEPFYP